jgi:hypothetical protein
LTKGGLDPKLQLNSCVAAIAAVTAVSAPSITLVGDDQKKFDAVGWVVSKSESSGMPLLVIKWRKSVNE